ncbi:MAG: redoxin domain-containing protein [Opitutaceae bacterium]|nr:redoxin domain-containing protein [Opitutaceae bacterium]
MDFPFRLPTFALLSVLACNLTLISGCRDRGISPAPVVTEQAFSIAPEWRLKDLAGAEVTLSQFKGKVVIVDFWATWCPPCRAEMPFYVNLYKRLANRGLVIVGISLDAQGPGVVKKFVDSNGITYPIVMGDEDVTAAYKVELMPSTFVVDREGRIRHSKIGAVSNEAEFERLIESYL